MAPLYWQATEPVDWALTLAQNGPRENISYKTIGFDFEPGFRAGLGYGTDWDTALHYTRYHARASDSASGIVTSAFAGGKLAQSTYRSGQVGFVIDYNMIDCDLGKSIRVTDSLTLRPLVGLVGGWINQDIDASFQGTVSSVENIKNDFAGIGPKVGIGTKLAFLSGHDYQVSLAADFAIPYLWGHWDISDLAHDNAPAPNPNTIVVDVASRDMGALAFQGDVGVDWDYKSFSMKFGYEINDWLNQCQFFDDATGGHNNDLVLQGITLNLSYHFD